MNSSLWIFVCVGIGVVAGLRSFTAPAVVCWGAQLGWLVLAGTRLEFMGSKIAVGVFSILAIVEIVSDKLPSTPNRTTAVPLGARIFMGVLCGAAVGIAAGQSFAVGAVLGVVGALIGAFGGYQIRHRLVAGLKVPDFVIAILEDVVAIGGGLLLVSRF